MRVGFLSIVIASCGPSLGLLAQVSPDGTLKVEIKGYPKEKSDFHQNPVIIRFTNTHNKTIRILRPLDGSEWSWHQPYYRFRVTDGSGQPLKLMERCAQSGLWWNTKWPEGYIIQILPGDSYEMQVGVVHQVPKDGEYGITFEYAYDPTAPTGIGRPYPKGLWSGTSKSDPVKLQLKKSM